MSIRTYLKIDHGRDDSYFFASQGAASAVWSFHSSELQRGIAEKEPSSQRVALRMAAMRRYSSLICSHQNALLAPCLAAIRSATRS